MVESTKQNFEETSVGIDLFLGDVEPKGATSFVPLNCTVKHRFSDFIVNEIDSNGEVVWFRAETDLQRWKKANIENTMPGMVAAETTEGDQVEEEAAVV